ncbi:MAG: DUF2062 domain-containing protein [Candidatus Scalindua sp.]|nr:DUF2062 domain-containing protein [Candidatus Scalindua sp.]MCR4343913.1 DUF2062 domain-containing protein [Candidatus Scalindua sp.]
MIKIRLIRLKARRFIRWLIMLRGSPEAIGLGIAIGIFVGFSPLMGFQMLIAIFFATFIYASRPAAMAAVWITNPLTFLPIYIFTYKVGKYILPGPEESDAQQIINKMSHRLITLDFWEIYHQFQIMNTLGRKIFVHLLLGGVIVGFIAGGVSYFLTVRIVKTYRKARLKK